MYIAPPLLPSPISLYRVGVDAMLCTAARDEGTTTRLMLVLRRGLRVNPSALRVSAYDAPVFQGAGENSDGALHRGLDEFYRKVDIGCP